MNKCLEWVNVRKIVKLVIGVFLFILKEESSMIDNGILLIIYFYSLILWL